MHPQTHKMWEYFSRPGFRIICCTEFVEDGRMNEIHTRTCINCHFWWCLYFKNVQKWYLSLDSWERNFIRNFIQIVCKLKVDSIFDIFEDRSSKKDSLLYIHTYLLTSTYLVILYQVHLRLKVADDAVFFCRTHQTKI